MSQLGDKSVIMAHIESLDIDFADGCILLNNQDITTQVRTEEIATLTSKIASISYIRTALKAKQRSFISPKGLVADGRDMGTRIFPEAQYKIFLTASSETRAMRRVKQLHPDIDSGKIEKIYSVILSQIKQRDERDKNNTIPAKDALIIDNTEMTLNEVVSRILGYMQEPR